MHHPRHAARRDHPSPLATQTHTTRATGESTITRECHASRATAPSPVVSVSRNASGEVMREEQQA